MSLAASVLIHHKAVQNIEYTQYKHYKYTVMYYRAQLLYIRCVTSGPCLIQRDPGPLTERETSPGVSK